MCFALTVRHVYTYIERKKKPFMLPFVFPLPGAVLPGGIICARRNGHDFHHLHDVALHRMGQRVLLEKDKTGCTTGEDGSPGRTTGEDGSLRTASLEPDARIRGILLQEAVRRATTGPGSGSGAR